ncbi:MAG TPA: glycosyltransferase family 39 protein [bacterium]|nr:glycosyltransferase family 39 protein [bacterium]
MPQVAAGGIPRTADSPAAPIAASHAWTRDIHFSPTLIFAGILAVALGLRIVGLGSHSVWLDEAFVVAVTRETWTGLLATLRAADSHPPLYYLIVKVWSGVAGTGEVALRLPSACATAATVALTYLLARRLAGEPTALLGAFLVAVSPFQIMAGQEARMYALLSMLAVGSTLALYDAVKNGGRARWALYALSAVLTAYTQYLGLLVLAGHGVWIFRYERTHARTWLAAMAVATAAFAPWLPALWQQALHAAGSPWYRDAFPPMLLADLLGLLAYGGSLAGTAGYFFAGTLRPFETLVVLIPFLVLLWLGGRALSQRQAALALVALPALVPIAAAFGVSLIRPMFMPRWFSFVMPFYAIVVAAGVVDVVDRFQGRREQAAALFVAALFLYDMPALAQYYLAPNARPFQWRAAAAVVQTHVRPGDSFLYVSPADLPFRYYFHGRYPSIVLSPPNVSTPGTGPGMLTASVVRDLALRHSRVWLVATLRAGGPAPRQLFSVLSSAYGIAWRGDFGGAYVFLLERRGGAPP